MGCARKIAVFLSVFLVAGFGTVAFAQKFPSKPIRLIVAFPPGGENDILCRAFQKPFGEALGTKVYVENIPGGSTKVGTMEVLKASPEGYTIIENADGGWVGLYYAKTYDIKVWEKLTPVATLTIEPWGIFEVKADSPYRTWADMVRIAKDNPGKLTCGTSYSGGMLELVFSEACKAAGIKAKYVPFGGGGPSLAALLGGHVDFRILAPSGALATIQSGKTRGLAVNSEKRMKLLPDVPTFKELGIGEGIWLTRSIWGPPPPLLS